MECLVGPHWESMCLYLLGLDAPGQSGTQGGEKEKGLMGESICRGGTRKRGEGFQSGDKVNKKLIKIKRLIIENGPGVLAVKLRNHWRTI